VDLGKSPSGEAARRKGFIEVWLLGFGGTGVANMRFWGGGVEATPPPPTVTMGGLHRARGLPCPTRGVITGKEREKVEGTTDKRGPAS
jgi:hypothetical protein